MKIPSDPVRSEHVETGMAVDCSRRNIHGHVEHGNRCNAKKLEHVQRHVMHTKNNGRK